MQIFNIDLTIWWLQTFIDDERELIIKEFIPNTKGSIGQYDREPLFTIESFNIKDEAIIPFLENLSVWLKKHDKISEKIYLKFLDVARLDPICDIGLLMNEEAYKNWIISRHLTLYNIHHQKKMGVENATFNYGNYEPAPAICKELSGRSFNYMNDADAIFSHWEIYKPNCRCVLLPDYEDILTD